MRALALALGLGLLTTACGDDGGGSASSCDDFAADNCVEVAGGDATGLIEAVNSLSDDTTIILGAGSYELDAQVTIRNDGINLVGQGMNRTILDFGGITTQANGVDVRGDDFLVQDLAVLDAPKDGIRVEESDGVTYRAVKTTWTNESDSENGAYGIYPVRCTNVLIEDSVAENAADAGLYVGQSRNVIVRRNVVRGNVAGLEIENTQYADVYDNLAEDNTGGLVVFDLPGNPVVGRDVLIRDNRIVNNNRANFAPGGTVREIPAGTGTFALASRRVEIRDNVYMNNDTVDIALLSGLILDGASDWSLQEDDLIGDWEDLGLLEGDGEGTVSNYRTENVVVRDNSHSGSGTDPDPMTPLGLGLIVAALYPDMPTPSVIYDTIGESAFDENDAASNSNDNHLCVGGNPQATAFGSMRLEGQPGGPHLVIPDAPFAPFDCTEMNGGGIDEVTLP